MTEESRNQMVNHTLDEKKEEKAERLTNGVSLEKVESLYPNIDQLKYTMVRDNSKLLEKLQNKMLSEQEKYEETYKKYRKGNRICLTATIGSNIAATAVGATSLTIGLSGIGLPVAIPVAAVSGLCYIVSIFGTAIGKKLESKMRKHRNISVLARSKSMAIDTAIFKSLEDKQVTTGEYELILKIVEDYYKQKADLRKRKVDTKELIEKAQKDVENKILEYLQRKK